MDYKLQHLFHVSDFSETWPIRKKMSWHFSGQRWEWLDGCVALNYKIDFQVKGWERDWDLMT